MDLSPNINNREFDKFDPDIIGSAVRTTAGIYTTITDRISAGLSYVGQAHFVDAADNTDQAIWRIKRIVRIGTETFETYAGMGDFDQIWDDRTTLFGVVPFESELALEFDGINDYLETAHSGVLNFERTDAFSFAHWSKFTSVTTSQFLFSKRENTGNIRGYQDFFNTTLGLAFILSSTNVGNRLFVQGPTLTLNTYYHILWTYDGSSLASGVRLYLNGVNTALSVTEDTLTGTIQTSVATRFGSRSSATTSYFSGTSDDVAVWDIELNSSQAAEVYNLGLPNDLSNLSTGSNLISWWKMGDGDTFPTITDHIGPNTFTMVNMTNSDIVMDVP